MSIWQIFNRSMSSNEKENWKELKDNLLALMRNNTGFLKNSSNKQNCKNIKKVIHSAICLCKRTVSIVIDNRINQKKKISKNSLVSQVHSCLESINLPDSFDSASYVLNASSMPKIEINLEEDKKILAQLKKLKLNKLSGWDSGIKKLMDYFYEISNKLSTSDKLSKEQVKRVNEKQESLNKNYKVELQKFISNNFSDLNIYDINNSIEELITKFAEWFIEIYKKSETYSRYSHQKFSELPSRGGRDSYVKVLCKGVISAALIELSKLTGGVQKEIDLITHFNKIKNRTPQSKVTPHLDLVIQKLNQSNLLKHFTDEESYLKKRFVKADYNKDNIKMLTHPSYLGILNLTEKRIKEQIIKIIDRKLSIIEVMKKAETDSEEKYQEQSFIRKIKIILGEKGEFDSASAAWGMIPISEISKNQEKNKVNEKELFSQLIQCQANMELLYLLEGKYPTEGKPIIRVRQGGGDDISASINSDNAKKKFLQAILSIFKRTDQVKSEFDKLNENQIKTLFEINFGEKTDEKGIAKKRIGWFLLNDSEKNKILDEFFE